MVDDMRFQRHRDAAGSGAAGRQEGKRKSLRRRWALIPLMFLLCTCHFDDFGRFSILLLLRRDFEPRFLRCSRASALEERNAGPPSRVRVLRNQVRLDSLLINLTFQVPFLSISRFGMF